MNTEHSAHIKARDLAQRTGQDTYVIFQSGQFHAVPATRLPKNAEAIVGYHPSGNQIREQGEPE